MTHPQADTSPVKPVASEGAIGIYVHVPFCETKCPYCDFNTYAGVEQLIPAYVDAVCEEIDRWGNLLTGRSAATIFFGGGTPSYIPVRETACIVDRIGAAFPPADDAEITLEANPGDVTVSKAESWLRAGFNRVSMGVQSFDDGLLGTLGRRHDAAGARRSFELLREAGFENRSLDLMFGLPDQTLQQWQDSMTAALDLEPDHVSLYGLQLEAGTPLEADVRLGRITTPDEDLGADMYLAAEEAFADAGFRHYEISNWARPGFESRHNLIYWRNEPYLGIGPGAHSSLLGHRFADTRSPRWYMRSLGFEPGPSEDFPGIDTARPKRAPLPDSTPVPLRAMAENGPVDTVEETTLQLELADTMMMGLRLDTGVSDTDFQARFGRSLKDVFDLEIGELVDQGLLESDEHGIRLSDRGRLLGNEVFGRFVSAAHGI